MTARTRRRHLSMKKALASDKVRYLAGGILNTALSYAIYLFQNPLLSLMKRLPIHLLGVNSLSIPLFDLIFLGLYVFVLILWSIFATYAIESPMRRILINRFNK